MPLTPNPSLHPPMGFFHREPDGTRFRGSSWLDVAEKVRQYREQHGKPAGDVLAEIYAAVCRQSPTYCRDSDNPRPPSQPRPERLPDAPRPPSYIPGKGGGGDVVARATNWIHMLLALKRKGGVEYVPKPEARRRASICASCPLQTSVSGSCGGCMTVLKSAKGVILAGQAPVEKAIAGCRVLGEDTSLSVFLVQAPAADGALPAHCWRKAI